MSLLLLHEQQERAFFRGMALKKKALKDDKFLRKQMPVSTADLYAEFIELPQYTYWIARTDTIFRSGLIQFIQLFNMRIFITKKFCRYLYKQIFD